MSVKKNILITDRFAQESLLTLSSQSYLNVKQTSSTSLENEELQNIHGFLIRSRTIIDESIFRRAKSLQVIITATSGFDHIDLKAAEKWGVTVMFTPEANIESAAQLTWALVLAGTNQIIAAHRSTKAGTWRDALPAGMELHRKTYGIIGLGRIGSRVAEIANVFGMNVIAYDPYIEDQQFKNAEAERVSFEEVLKRSDILSFHVPATAETQGLIHRGNLDFINRGILLVNTSRGSVIVEADLCEALAKNDIAYAGLDVYEKEPLSRNSRLLTLANVTLTPHIGAYTNEAFQKASEIASMKLIRFFMDGSTSDTLPPKAAWYGVPAPFQHNKS